MERLQNRVDDDDHGAVVPRSSGRVILWFVVGFAVLAGLQLARVEATGGRVEALLYAGDLQPAHEVVVESLPNAPIADGWGHDGQIFFAIGTDLTGKSVPGLLENPGYRYRRILYPAFSTIFGTIEGRHALWAMALIASAAGGIAAASVAAIGSRLGLASLSPIAVVLNPGTWLSAILLTADNLALMFGLLAVTAYISNKHWVALIGTGLAGLTKEVYIAFALGLALHSWKAGFRRRSIAFALAGVLPLSAWGVYVAAYIGNPLGSGGGLSFPFGGLIEGLRVWPLVSADDIFYGALALVGLLLAIIVVIRHDSVFRWLALPWVLVAIGSSDLVWNLGNNAVRTLAPLLTLGLLGLLGRGTIPTGRQQPASHLQEAKK